MNWSQWLELFGQQLAATPWLEWIAVSLGVSEVLFARANKIWLYPTGIAATSLTIFIFYKAGLFAECYLNGYYIVMSIYGWWHWIKKKHEPPVKISRCNAQDWKIVTAIVLVAFTLFVIYLKTLTTSTVPYWDAWVSATAWAGMWLLAKRKIENWVLLNISNAFAIPLLLHKGLPMYAALTTFLFLVAVQGYFKWNKIIKQDTTPQADLLIN